MADPDYPALNILDGMPASGLIRLKSDRSAWEAFYAQEVLARVTSQTSWSNDASEKTVLSYAVPANKLGTVGRLAFRASGTITNNSGVARTVTVKVSLGGTVLYQQASGSIASNPSGTRGWTLDVDLQEMNSTSAQRGRVKLEIATAVAPTTGETGGLFDPTGSRGPNTFTGTKDDTGILTFLVTVTLSAADGGLSMTVEEACLEFKPAAT